MVNNTVKGRFQLKKDTEAHWNLARNFIPLAGEPIIYTVDENHASPRFKVGDGSTYVIDLPFLSANSIENEYIKSGTTAYWNSQINYVPPLNTIIVYTDKSTISQNGTTINIPGIKIGDGNSYCIDLPFVNNEFEQHMNNTDIHTTLAEKTFWNNKLNYSDSFIEDEENLIFTRN